MFFAAFGLFLHAQDVTPIMKLAFKKKLDEAVLKKDFKEFSALYCEDGKKDPAREIELEGLSQKIFEEITGMAIPTYEFAAPPPDLPPDINYKGKIYQPNLKIAVLMYVYDTKRVPNATDSGIKTLPLGIKDGALMIARPVLKE